MTGFISDDTTKLVKQLFRNRCISICPDCTHLGEVVHEVVPRSLGGKIQVDNQVLLCYVCHDFIHQHGAMKMAKTVFKRREEILRKYMDKSYDCTEDVLKHKERVEFWIHEFTHQLNIRGITHDNSKLFDPVEKELFDKWTPELKKLTFGSDEYKIALDGMGEGVKRHYQANKHHPEHYPTGINDMTLIDLVEMVIDWMAAAQARNVPVDLKRGAERFGICDQLIDIIANTLREVDVWSDVGGLPVGKFCPPEKQNSPAEGSE